MNLVEAWYGPRSRLSGLWPLHLLMRALVAQARHERLTLITHDRRLFAYDVPIIRA